MVLLINQDQYTSCPYLHNITNNNYRIGFDNNNINNCHSIINIDTDVWTHGISPHFSSEYTENTKHICTILYNILNRNQNSLSSLNVQYIGYFYHVFPLHPNTFHRLFQHSTQPQLDQLKTLIFDFLLLDTKIISHYQTLTSFNNSHSIFLSNITSSFGYLSILIDPDLINILFIIKTKQHLNSIIESTHKILSRSLKYISYIIRIIGFYFTILLQTDYENFKNKIKEHKESLEKSIKKYIQKIKQDLTEQCCCVEELIGKICDNIKTLKENYGKRDQFNKYTDEEQLISKCILKSHRTHIRKIFEAHEEYKKCLESCPDMKNKLNELKHYLTIYHCYICRSANFINQYNSDTNKSYIIDQILDTLENFKPYVNEFNNYVSSVQKLEKIGEHISTMKFNLNEVQGKVKDEVKSYIQELKDIEVDPYQFEEDIKQIKLMNESIIDMLRIVKHTIVFYKSLDVELKKLNGVKFAKYDFTEFLRNSNAIEEKLKQFQEQIKSHLKTLNESYKNIPGHTFLMEGDVYRETYYKDLISPIQKFIDTTLLEISTIRYIIYYLMIIKFNSVIIIDSVKKKINEINDMDTALKNLPEILRLLRTFYSIHRNSMNMVILFNFISFARFYINKYVDILWLIKYYIEILIFTIKCYIWILSVIKFVTNELKTVKPKIEHLKSKSNEMNKLKDYTSNIISSLKSIDSSLKTLKSVNSNLDIKTLKNNMSVIKYHINQVYQNVLGINLNLNEIYNLILKLYIIYFKIMNVQKSINDMIKEIIRLVYFLNTYYLIIVSMIGKNNLISNEKMFVFLIHSNLIFKLIENLESIIKYLSGINKVIDEMKIKEFIENIESQITNINNLNNMIESKLKLVESSVDRLECAIEGVPRNLIQCTLQSLSTHITSSNTSNLGVGDVDNPVVTNYSMMNVGDYQLVINRMLEFWTFSDESVELFKYVRYCLCALHFESQYQGDRPSTFPYSLHTMKTTDLNPVSELRRATIAENVGNHLCLCLVIKYHLRPTLLKCILYLRNEELGALDTISRKFQRYNSWAGLKQDLWRACALTLNIIYEITSFLRNIYLIHVRNICMCSFYDEKYYNYFVSIILVLSSLIENIWTMDIQTLNMSIEKISRLINEFEKIDSQNDKSSKNNHLSLYNDIKFLSKFISLLSIGLIFESLKFLAYYLRSIIALLPTQTLRVTLFWQYLFNIVFSLDNFGYIIQNILKLSIDTVLSNFILIPELLFKFINDKCDCKCKNKICSRRILIALSTKVVYYKIIWVKKNILNNNRLYNIKESKNSQSIKGIVDNNIRYNIISIKMTKKMGVTHLNPNSSYKGVKDASTTNWGYDTICEHEITGDNSFISGDGYPSLTCIGNNSNSKVRSGGR